MSAAVVVVHSQTALVNMKTVTITLTEAEATNLSTVITQLTGALQYHALSKKGLNKAWKHWRGIGKKIASPLGYEALMVPNPMTRKLLDSIAPK
jgi:hypothetical protein